MYERYATLRDALGVTDYYISKHAKVAKTTLYQWKSGQRKPQLETLQKLAAFFDIPLEQLTGEAALPDRIVQNVHALAGRLADLPTGAINVAIAYSQANERDQAFIRHLLKL